jgi:DNA-directed RNA polymerase subunit omega
MLLYPTLEQLMQRVDTKYTLVVMAATRARDLMAGTDGPRMDTYSDKAVGIAMEEIAAGVIYPRRKRDQRQSV